MQPETARPILGGLTLGGDVGTLWRQFQESPPTIARIPNTDFVVGLAYQHDGNRYYIELQDGRCSGQVSFGMVKTCPGLAQRDQFTVMTPEQRAAFRLAVLDRLPADPDLEADLRRHPEFIQFLELSLPSRSEAPLPAVECGNAPRGRP